jgi:hypothetical protein
MSSIRDLGMLLGWLVGLGLGGGLPLFMDILMRLFAGLLLLLGLGFG